MRLRYSSHSEINLKPVCVFPVQATAAECPRQRREAVWEGQGGRESQDGGQEKGGWAETSKGSFALVQWSARLTQNAKVAGSLQLACLNSIICSKLVILRCFCKLLVQRLNVRTHNREAKVIGCFKTRCSSMIVHCSLSKCKGYKSCVLA